MGLYSRLSGAAAAIAVAFGFFAGAPAKATADDAAIANFYRGKTMDLIIGYSPGGGYDQYARLVGRFLGKHIPGNPSIVPRNLPGASSRTAAAFLYAKAPQDGTVIGTADQSLALAQVMGDSTLRDIDTGKFGYVGSPTMENNIVITWHKSKVTDVEKARQIAVPIGATGGSTSSQYPLIMNNLLGTRFEIIMGYPGGNDINMAMENGEVDGRGSVNWGSVKPLGWVDKKMINILVQVGLQREKELPNVPLLMDFAAKDEDKQMLRLISAPTTIGRPIFSTPNVPPERLDALRKAFDAMVKDPEFLAAAQKEGLLVEPISGKQLEQIVTEIVSTPKDVGAKLAKLIGVQ
ncbi:hypothetical protein PMI07_005447 [Rhizobium sp. CF080]|uniref:Bug family tripartite tricarboxylate transporter substrate binding protein n=1 Tax=Rhizobium sp. (strain CF080) TaxID=1144310 RepID=UPI00027191EC|nr:hypothetical protein [Rhizobium sp. CF080]EUB99166.1 hypothetical protein PMI07_005447 [Rhizobium sp. CF080]